ncbi:ICMT-domain-containing protein [Irpex rosettiformis]|uniref:ICMT-domain-containing protein n=1 Tax=Irpex rosettiformis TaxID=378272 RepID=A0ACB8TYE0_9APHY|nr:ICMT-domain-containing protein [Irpex rosettiformis]
MPSQLWKIPLLLASARLYQQSTTPPNKPAAASEKLKYGSTTPDFMSTMTARRIAKSTVSLMWVYSLVESAVIIAHNHPTPYTRKILSLLVRKEYSAANVRITPLFLAGCALLFSGCALRVACYRELGRFFTWDLSIKPDQKLITTGPYSVVRHPAYTGNCLIALGLVLAQVSGGSWFTECGGYGSPWTRAFAAVWLGWHLSKPYLLGKRVTVEDEVLRREFGERWDEYAKRTPYRLFPFVY